MESLTITSTNNFGLINQGINEMYSRWIQFIDASPKTVDTYTKAVKQFLIYLSENEITQPAKEDIINFKRYLEPTHKPTTIQNYIMALKQFFKWTEEEGLYKNIAKNVKGAKLDTEHKKDYLTSNQTAELLNSIDRSAFKGLRDYAILSLMVTTGLRTVEIVRANNEDIRTVADFTALFIQGKGHTEKAQYVRLASPVEKALRDYIQARGKTAGSEPLFTSTANRNNSERLTTRSISRIVKEHLINIGLDSDRLTAHSLRHTAATLNLLNGGTVEETQQLLRHTNINTTLIYSHALERAQNNSEGRIANAIFG